MEKRYFYKAICLILLMGAPEALTFLDALQRHGILSRRTVAQYVMSALYGGCEIKEGTAGYEKLEQAVFREVFDEMQDRRMNADFIPVDEPVSNEAGMYLRGILEVATGDRRHGMICLGMRYDGFTKAAYEEVRNLLGRTGMRYLGIADRFGSLEPSKSMVSAIVQEDESEGIPYSTAGRGPLCGNDPFEDDPWLEELRENMKQYEDWMEAEKQMEIEEVILNEGNEDVFYQSVFGLDLTEV